MCGTLDESARREWLVADGMGGYACGTVAGLRTRTYHGLLMVAVEPPRRRMLGLAALDAAVLTGSTRLRLATDEWRGGVVDPRGHELLALFELSDGVPHWQWAAGAVVVEREVAMVHGRPAVAVVHRLLAAPGPVRLELTALCTWRDQHAQRLAGPAPDVRSDPAGFVFEGAYRVTGPGWRPGGSWYTGMHLREEAARGLTSEEDLWCAGTFDVELSPGQAVGVLAAARFDEPLPDPEEVVRQARARSARLAQAASVTGQDDRQLVCAADQFVTSTPDGPAVVAGYPWFGDWSRDTMTSYEGLFLVAGRAEEGRRLLQHAAASLSEGMLANTSDTGAPTYNTVDGTLWFLHAVARHVAVTGDHDLAAELAPALADVVRRHVAGARFGIAVDPADGLLSAGAEGEALTWMDARVAGVPVTRRAGKPVEIQALWISGLRGVAGLLRHAGQDADWADALAARATASFLARFATPSGLLDVVDGPGGADASLRPNQLLAVSLPDGPLRARPDLARQVVRTVRDVLLTPLGLRSLAPTEPGYRGHHRGGSAERDSAYHQGTVWPWLLGPYVDAARATGLDAGRALDGVLAHLHDWGLGSVSETAEGDPPHAATGCPFQAWSVAELLRARRSSS